MPTTPQHPDKHQPRVSIICRTIGRPTLDAALDSVNAQSWSALELVLVDALGTQLQLSPKLREDLLVKIVCTGQPLSRPAAANAGIDAATGDFLLFLDDDDWIAPAHIEKLLTVIRSQSGIQVVYSATQKTHADGALTDEIIAVPFDRNVLRRDNFVPIHAALFSHKLIDAGCRFDTSLDVYEDWDFWLQCAEHTDFLLAGHTGAFYRMGGDSRTMLDQYVERYSTGHPIADARARLFDKWRTRWSGADWNAVLGLVDQTPLVHQLHQELGEAHGNLNARDKKLTRSKQQNTRLQNQLKELHAEFDTLKAGFDAMLVEYRDLQTSHLRLQDDYQSLQSANEYQQNALHELQGEFARLDSAHKLLLSDYDTLQTGYADLAGANEQLTEQRTQLTEQLAQRDEQLAQLNEQRAQLQSQYDNLYSAHIELNLAHEKLDQGVREILDSFSWRVTAPYRFVRTRINRMFASLASGKRPAHKPPASSPTPGTSDIRCGIVVPGNDNIVFTHAMTVQGWAWSSTTIASVGIYLDGAQIHVIDPVPDHDHPEDAQRTGFARLIDVSQLSAGTHTISVRAQADDGTQAEVQRTFVYQQPTLLYRRWLAATRSSADNQPPAASGASVDAVNVIINLASHSLTDWQLLTNTLTSIQQQSFANWHLFILPGDTDPQALTDCLEALQIPQDKISRIQAPAQVPADRHQLLTILEPGELLHEHCLLRAATMWQPDTRLLYSDHDLLDARGEHHSPWFTFCWAPDLLASQNYIGDVYFISAAEFAELISDADSNLNARTGWRYLLLLQLADSLSLTSTVRVAEVLWSEPEDRRSGIRPRVASSLTEAPLTEAPLVSIIIPTTGNLRFLKPCLDTLADTNYPAMEIVILDNSRGKFPEGIQYARDTGATVITCDESFNWSRLNNIGVDNSKGDLLLFLNDDIEVMHDDWLTEMAGHALRPDAGTVGCMLLYPNGAIQHGGVFLVDHGGGARHLFHKQLPGDGIYQNLDQCIREVSANTGACLMIRRELFEELGRFDENLSIVGNDIDLCLRCLEAGHRNIWTPFSRLIHHESVSRQNKPIGKDEKSMWQRWGHRFKGGDPYYNPSLSLVREDFALAEIPVTAASAGQGQPAPVSEPAPAPAPPASAPAPDQTVAQTPDMGVNLIAYIRASMGVGEAARGNAAALQASGIPFGIINYERGNPSRMDNLRWQHKEISGARYQINLLHINADHTPAVIRDLGASTFRNRYNIGFWAWEMPEFPDRWLESFDLLDEIWVPSTYVNQAIAAKSPVPVVTIPHVINVDMAGAEKYPRSWFGIDEQAFVFVSMFDIHSIAQRKNPFGSILAFQKAFAPDDASVQLLIKINNADEATIKVLRSSVADYTNILLLAQHYDRAQIDSLINCADCFVSLHHAEGFGLAPAEAMAMGKVALLTNWSGNTEYMQTDNCVPIRYQLKSLGKDYGPYEAHQHWAVPDLEHAAQEMKDLAGNPGRVKILGQNGKTAIARDFSARAVGERMRQRLTSIQRILKNQHR
tara:strand:+ start:96008 stop:100549 length:4542 start_codon:yes stop_codon:yes gene_type:complete